MLLTYHGLIEEEKIRYVTALDAIKCLKESNLSVFLKPSLMT